MMFLSGQRSWISPSEPTVDLIEVLDSFFSTQYILLILELKTTRKNQESMRQRLETIHHLQYHQI